MISADATRGEITLLINWLASAGYGQVVTVPDGKGGTVLVNGVIMEARDAEGGRAAQEVITAMLAPKTVDGQEVVQPPRGGLLTTADGRQWSIAQTHQAGPQRLAAGLAWELKCVRTARGQAREA